MIHVALDTNVYTKNPRLDSPEFRALAFLAKNDCICLHVPFFIEKEFSTQVENDQSNRIQSVLTTITKMQNHTKPGTTTQDLSKLSKHLVSQSSNIIKERSDSFINWLSDIGAKRYKLSKKQTDKALDAYFYGKPPLKSPKVRKDIPDSFIYQSLLDIHKTEEIRVVANDGALHDACMGVGMQCYKELNDFIEDPDVRACLEGKINENILGSLSDHINNYLEQNTELVLNKIESLLLSDDYRLISGDYLPGESNEIYVSGVSYPEELQYIGDIEYFGDGLFVVEFMANVELTYEYAVYRSDIYDYDSKKYYIEYLNDHYFNVETTDNFNFYGRLNLEFDVQLQEMKSVNQLFQTLEEPSIDIEDLDHFEIIT